MSVIDYIVLAGLVIVAAGIVLFLIRRKKQGKGACGHCEGCPYKGSCTKMPGGDDAPEN